MTRRKRHFDLLDHVFTVDQLHANGDNLLNLLRDVLALPVIPAGTPLLTVHKGIGSDNAFGNTTEFGAELWLFEPFAGSDAIHTATVRHELTHVNTGAIDLLTAASRTRQENANNEGAVRYEARRGRRYAGEGRLRIGEHGAGDSVPAVASARSWRDSVGEDPILANLWIALLERYRFISDPEGTGEFRGLSLADESRYVPGLTDTSGHPADSVDEFISSFVTSATLYRSDFIAAVVAAQTAGDATGGRGGSYLRSLYRRAWTRINEHYTPLGPNPF